MGVLEFTDCFFADPDDSDWPQQPTTRLVDLNTKERNRDLPGFFVSDIAFPSNNQETVTFGNMGEDGDELAAARHAGGFLRIRLGWSGDLTRAEGGEQQDLIDDFVALQEALDQDRGVFVLQIEGREDPLYYDFRASQIVPVLEGQSSPFDKLVERLVRENLIVNLNLTHPWGRGAPVTLPTVGVTNDYLQRDFLISNPGNRPSEIQVAFTPSAGTLAGWRWALRTHGNLTEFRSLYMAELASGTMGEDTSSASPSGASGGTAARCTFAGNPTFEKRVRKEITATDDTALPGAYRLFLRCKPTGGATTEKEFKVQMFYGFSSGDPLAFNRARRTRKELDFADITTPDWVEVDMGFCVVPDGATRVVFEVWAERTDGDWSMDFDLVIAEPADYARSHLCTLGFRMGDWGRRRYRADELEGTGTLKRGTYRLNANGEIGRVEPNAGFLLEEGTYEAVFNATLREEGDSDGNYSRTKLGEGQVIKNPTGSPVTKAAVRLRTRKRLWTKRVRRAVFRVTSAEETANDRFRPQVEHTATTDDGRKILINHISLHYLRGLTADSPGVMDSNVWARVAYARDGVSDEALFPINNENWLPRVPPGNSLLILSAIDLPENAAGYDGIDEDEPLGISTIGRTTSIEFIITPRFAHPFGA